MNKIAVQLPANRDYAGRLEIQNAAGQRIAGPFPVCGRADDASAQDNQNPGRNPLLPFGDIPFGEYQIVKIMPSGPGTAYRAEEFGSTGIVLMRPKLGDAALADANGRFGFFIQGGARTRSGLLRPTQDGSLRLSDRDQRRFISALRKAGDIDCFCLVVSTAKVGAKVAVAKVPAGKARRNTPASLLLASSVIVSTVTGVVRQAWVRSMFHAAGTSIASGLAFVAADHASAQSKGDYTPTGGAADQLNAVEQHSQDATHAATDEQAHDQAAQGFDTASPVAPPVDLQDKQGVVTPDAASGGLPPASAADTAPGSPIVTEPEPSTTPEEAPAANEPTETQPADQNPPEEMTPPENTTAPETTPEMAPTENTTSPETAPAENTTPPETTEIPAATPEEDQTAPATESATPSSAPSLGAAAAAAAGAAIGSAIIASPESTAAPTAQEPATQAIIEHDQNAAVASPQNGQPAQNSFADGVQKSLSSFESENPDATGKAYFSEGGGNRTAEDQARIVLNSDGASYPNIKSNFTARFNLDTLPAYDQLTTEQKDWLVSQINQQAGQSPGFPHVGGNAQDVSVKNLTLDQKTALMQQLTGDGYGVLKEKYENGKSVFNVDITNANVLHVYKK